MEISWFIHPVSSFHLLLRTTPAKLWQSFGKDCHVSIRIWSLPNADERIHVKLNSAHPTAVPLKWAVQVMVSFVHHPFLEMTGIMEQSLLSYLHWQLLHLKNLKQKLQFVVWYFMAIYLHWQLLHLKNLKQKLQFVVWYFMAIYLHWQLLHLKNLKQKLQFVVWYFMAI